MSATSIHGVVFVAAMSAAGAQTYWAPTAVAQPSIQTAAVVRDSRLPPCCGSVGGTIVFDGDSVSLGLRASAGKTPDRQLAAMLPWPARVADVAVSGLPVYKALERYGTAVAPLRNPDEPYQLIAFHAGDNDILAGMTAAQTYASFAAYVARAHDDGWLVIVTTELQQPTLSAHRQAEITEYDRLLLANTAGADDVVDFAAFCGFGDPAQRGNRNYFAADGVHPSDNGYKLLAQMLLTSMKRLGLFATRTTTQRPSVEPLPPCAL